MIASRFGTVRGLIRLVLSHGEVALGRGAVDVGPCDDIRRIVFICHGNICRSAFADVAARNAGIAATSFGLSTDSGKPAHAPAIAAAAMLGHDLSDHRATMMSDYMPRDGDLLLAMETRQLRRLAADPRLGGVPRGLLGLYTRPRSPHLHDPYMLSDDYMATCLARIESAMPVLRATFVNARTGKRVT